MKRIIQIILLFSFSFLNGYAQTIQLPEAPGWNRLAEGQEIHITLTLPDSVPVRAFALEEPSISGMSLDSTGHFNWSPGFDLVDRVQRQKDFSVSFLALLRDGRRIRQSVTFTLLHTNRAPVIQELPVFYVKQSATNLYQIPSGYVSDPDGDPIIFRPSLSHMPEGAALSSGGLFSWSLSRNQFNSLKSSPVSVVFTVQDPEKLEAEGKLRIAQTQLDLPPEIMLVPGDTAIVIKEDQVLNIKMYVSDPNGDDDIMRTGFVCSDAAVPESLLKKTSPVQAEFTWSPGYSFVDEAEKFKRIELVFFSLDKSANRAERKLHIKVIDTENIEAKDKIQVQKYTGSLSAAKFLIDQLDKNFEKLESSQRRAKNGKKKRTILNASLGAITGISPLALDAQPSKTVSVIGGTAVMTLSSLEAGQVIGKNANEFQEKKNINRDLRTQLQLKGNYFARKYATKSSRRTNEFEADRDEITKLLNYEKLPLLDIPADTQNQFTAKEIKKTFSDYSED
ncbi:MAG: hypothetical protein K1X47_11835 [Cyclobacteriaceae bacterium]|nr:hypothetical protein [Cyclobacteriaceae bacterium]